MRIPHYSNRLIGYAHYLIFKDYSSSKTNVGMLAHDGTAVAHDGTLFWHTVL